jgi:hypothetical protein
MVGYKQPLFGNYLFKLVRTVSLDTSILLIEYARLLGRNSQIFFQQWLPHIVVPDVSLFSLSQALFDKNARQFFTQWQRVSALYSPPFWVSFWSEQLWRACCYIYLQKNGKKDEAKKMCYRLPFSFIETTWRHYTIDELRYAHQLLYDIDYHLKQGGSEHGLELLYARFFTATG